MRLQKAPPAAFFVSPTHSPHQSVSIGMRRAVTLFLLAILCCSSFGVVLTVPSLRQYNSIQRSVSKSDEDYNIPGAFIKPTLSFHASQKFVAYYAKVVAKLINNNVSGLVIPELEFTDHQPGIGNVSVSLKNFTIKSMEASEDEAYGKLGNGSIEVKMSKIKFQIESQFQYQKLQYPRFHGKGLITFSGADGFLDLNFGVNETSGSPQLNIFAANSTFNQIKIKIKKSKAAWLYNLLIKIVKQKLDSAVSKKVTSLLTTMLPEKTNKIIKELPKAIPIMDLALNISIVDQPIINPDFLSLNIFGIIQRQQETQDCPYLFDPIKIPSYAKNGKMVTIFAYARILKCVMWTLQRSGHLSFKFKQADVPGHPEVLNTTTWATVIPQFQEMYPNSATMSIDMSIEDVPDVKIAPAKGITATAKQIIAKLYAREERDYLMILKFYVKVAASAKLVAGSDAALTGVQVKLTDGDFNASLVESNIGSFDFTKMNMGLKILVGEGLLALGKFLDSAPLIIPAVPSIKFSDTSLVIGNDFIKVESDILYS